MKKIMFAVMAMCAIGFTACGNKAQAPADVTDSVEAMVYNAEEEAAASINQLTEQIEAQDASKFQAYWRSTRRSRCFPMMKSSHSCRSSRGQRCQ